MSHEQVYAKIINALVQTCGADSATLSEDVLFGSIENLDSVAIVSFQMEISKTIGPIADEVIPLPEMSIGDFIEILESIA